MAKINRRLILTVLLSFCRSKGCKAPSDGLSPPIQPLVEFLSPPPRQKKKTGFALRKTGFVWLGWKDLPRLRTGQQPPFAEGKHGFMTAHRTVIHCRSRSNPSPKLPSQMKRSTMFYHSASRWLGWKDLNPRNDGARTRCLTPWLHPSIWFDKVRCLGSRGLILRDPRTPRLVGMEGFEPSE